MPVQWIFRRKCRRSVLIKGGPNTSLAGSAPLSALMAVLDQHAAWVSECPHRSFVRFHSFSSLGTKFQDESHSSLETLEKLCGHMTQPQDGGGQAAHVDISSEMQAFPNMRYQCISCPIQRIRICKDMQDLIVLGIFLSQHQWLSVIQNYVFRRDHCGERNDGLCVLLVLLSIMIRISAKDDDDDGEGGAVLL